MRLGIVPVVDEMPWLRPDQIMDGDFWLFMAEILRNPAPDLAASPFWDPARAEMHAAVCEWRAWALERVWADADALTRLMALCADGHSLDSGLLLAVGRP